MSLIFAFFSPFLEDNREFLPEFNLQYCQTQDYYFNCCWDKWNLIAVWECNKTVVVGMLSGLLEAVCSFKITYT